MKRIKTREFLRRTLTDVFSMTPWPLEMAGAFALWHYGKLFTSDVALSQDFQNVIAQLMPGESWGTFARTLAYALWILGALSVTTGARLYLARIIAAMAGLIVWSVLTYSCWRGDVPLAVYELYAFFVLAQAYTALLIQTRRRADEAADAEANNANAVAQYKDGG